MQILNDPSKSFGLSAAEHSENQNGGEGETERQKPAA